MNKKVLSMSLVVTTALLVACGDDKGTTVDPSDSSAVQSSSVELSSSTPASSIANSSSLMSNSSSSSDVPTSYGPQQVLIEASGKTFQMGADLSAIAASISNTESRSDFEYYLIDNGIPEGPAHAVTFSADFYMDATEVTQGQMIVAFEAVESPLLGTLQATWDNAHNIAHVGLGNDYPAIIQYPYLAATYANIRSELEGLTPVYELDSELYTFTANFEANGYRLPTEAEWEFAARGGTTTDFIWNKAFTMPLSESDSLEISEYATWKANSFDLGLDSELHGPHIVGSKEPNAFGLYDMIGNLSEYVNEHWSSDPYAAGTVTDPQDGSALENDMDYIHKRGGNWMNGAMFLRTSSRTYGFSGYKEYGVGFRLVRKAP